MTNRKTISTKVEYRRATFNRDAIDPNARTAQLAFSSEEPYERFFGIEILDHGRSSVRLGRLQDAGPLLLDHDPSRHIGVVEDVSIGPDKVGRALVRFGRSEEAEEAFQDVVDGIRVHVSVGYIVHRMRLVSEKDGQPTYVADDWEPLEVSLVSIPADTTVGVGRSVEQSVSTEVVAEAAPDPETDPTPEPEAAAVAPDPIIELISPEEKTMSEAQTQQPAVDKRAEQIAAIGEQYASYVKPKDIAEAIRGGTSVEKFQELVMSRMTTQHQELPKVGMTRKETERYSLCRAVLAAANKDWSGAGLEREAAQAAATLYGREADGFFVPYDVLSGSQKRDFTAGTAGEAGNLVATSLRDDLMTDVLRNRLVFGELGATFLNGLSSNIDIPRKSVASTLAFVTEIATASETQPTTVKITLSPKRISAFIQASKQAMIQANLDVEAMLRQDLLDGTAVLFENAAINGSGAGANPRGIRNVSGIGSVVGGTNGANVAWSHIVGLESAVANVNAEPDSRSGYLTNTKVRGTAKQTQKATNLQFLWDNGPQPLNGYRASISNNVPSNLTKGTSSGVCSSILYSSDWSMLVLATFGAFDVVVDPYSQKNSGMVEIAINAYVDVGCRQPGAFASMDDALTP